MNNSFGGWLTPLLVLVAYLYVAGLFGWFLLQLLYEDRWWWLFLLNTFAIYLFLPLPLVLLIALGSGQRGLWLGSGVAILLVLYLYGGLFWPKPATAQATQPTLTVMTFNALAYSAETTAVVEAIRTANADIVALQEMNSAVATALDTQLQALYPYQVLAPRAGPSGMGVISRYPLQLTAEQIPGVWLGSPQVLRVEFQQRAVLLINCHAISVPFRKGELQTLRTANTSVPAREEQMQAVADFVTAQPLPTVVVGDFNTADQTRAYRLITRVLRDSWREGGYGLGHTFPGADSSASSRPVFLGIPVPMWLVRIDYIFHTTHWRTVNARIGPWDGVSDHRPVVASLMLVE